MKKGEAEAMQILKLKGIAFDESYCDDNSKNSMPDLRYAEGRFLEVTHTYHNNSIVTKLNKFHQKSIEEQLEISTKAEEAYDRLNRLEYPQNEEGQKLYKADAKLLKSHFGLDVRDMTKNPSEFNCDSPTIFCSYDNIIYEIVNDKGKKYSNGDTYLFVFVLDDEYESVKYLHNTGYQNGCYINFMNTILNSPFPTIYLCVWDFENQKYIIENPILLKFQKSYNGGLNYKLI